MWDGPAARATTARKVLAAEGKVGPRTFSLSLNLPAAPHRAALIIAGYSGACRIASIAWLPVAAFRARARNLHTFPSRTRTLAFFLPKMSVSLLAGPVTRTWRCGPRHSPVQLYHNTITGERWLSCEGLEVPGTVGSFYPFSGHATLNFEVQGAGKGHVTMDVAGTRVVYRCYFAVSGGGEAGGAPVEVPEENSVALGSSSSAVGGTAGAAGAAAASEATHKLRVAVEAAEYATDEQGKPVVWFRVRADREAGSRGGFTVVHRRFNNFLALGESVGSSFKGSHLMAALPPLPPRGIKFLENQSDPAFIEKRRWLLQDYLYKLEQVPRVRENSDFQTFVGLVDDTREASVIFPVGSQLGLTLVQAGAFTEIGAFKPLADGRPSPALAVPGLLGLGDKVSKVNGEDVLDRPYEVVIAMLKSAPRPLVVHFLGNARRGAGEGGGAAAAAAAAAGAASPFAGPTMSFAAFAGTSESAMPAPAPAAVAAPAPVPAPAPAPVAAGELFPPASGSGGDNPFGGSGGFTDIL
jgi:hypothetical protein